MTFQLSAVTDKGITFVIMPLLSLIEDNLNFVLDLGIPACTLSGSNSDNDKGFKDYYDKIRKLEFKIVYMTPEKLVKSSAFIQILDELNDQ